MNVECDHKGHTIDLYDSHGGYAEWCIKCGSARGSQFSDEWVKPDPQYADYLNAGDPGA